MSQDEVLQAFKEGKIVIWESTAGMEYIYKKFTSADGEELIAYRFRNFNDDWETTRCLPIAGTWKIEQ